MEKFNLTCSLGEMVKRVESEPKMKMVYSGIKENSVGFIFGPSKSGKTIFCENLGMSIASGQSSFMGLPISIENRKVLFISLEEFYTGRTDRNTKQLGAFTDDERRLCTENYRVITDHMPKYIASKGDWTLIKEAIVGEAPGVVFIDSLTRLHEGSIEESRVAKEVMRELRELCDETKVTLIIIHHTPKIGNEPFTVHSMAGSRVLAQEADFGIGINKVADGRRYVKDVFFRYAQENDETVKVFEINDFIWASHVNEDNEYDLLSSGDGRVDYVKSDVILEAFANGEEITTGELKEKYVNTRQMSKQTLHTRLNKLVQEGKIIDIGHGKYMSAA